VELLLLPPPLLPMLLLHAHPVTVNATAYEPPVLTSTSFFPIPLFQ
jgi:hypothetical protein